MIEHKKIRIDGEVEIQKFVRGSFLGKGGFAKCYEFIRVADRQIFAGKNIAKSSLTKSRARQNREYGKARASFLVGNPKCRVCGKEATEVHHKRGRIGKLLTAVKHFLAVCRTCHQRIEENPVWAKENNYSESRLTNLNTL